MILKLVMGDHPSQLQQSFCVIPAKAGIQSFKCILDPGSCPGPDPGFAGVTE
jgi:hypothetical protein